MFRNLLFTMSLSGSIVVVLYLIFYPLARRYFPLVWRYRVLKIAMFFYLIPVVECKYYVFYILRMMFPKSWDEIYITPNFDISYSAYIGDGFVKLSPSIYKMVSTLCICGIISGLIFSRIVIQNHKIKKLYEVGCGKFAGSELEEVFLEMRKELNIKRKIKFVSSEYCRSPVTSGVVFPVVWFPDDREKEIDKKAFQYMVKHELLHIKRNDILVKYLGLLIMAIHWFNPFSYFLYHELSSIGEMYCDHGVLEGQGEAGRKEYGELLLQAAVRKAPSNRYSLFVGMADKGYQKAMKRRIIEMKANSKNNIFFSVVVMMFICILGILTAFAYEPPYRINVIHGDRSADYKLEEEDMIEPILYDQYLVDENGTIYEITELDSLGQLECVHNYVNSDTIYVNHIKNNTEGCNTTKYSTQKCSFCTSVIAGDKISTLVYEECPH